MKKIEIKIILVLIMTCLIFVGCENKNDKNIGNQDPITESNIDEQNDKKVRNEIIEDNSEIAERITYDNDYDYENGNVTSLYILGLKVFDEFSTKEFGYLNEGNIIFFSDKNILKFYITTHTGPALATGSLAGPDVRFTMNVNTNEIIEKEFNPAPNYAEQAKLSPDYINPDSIKYSEKTIELSDERLIEIGLYFKDYIIEIEKNRKEKQE